MNKEEFNKLSDYDKLRWVLNQTIKEHKPHLKNPYHQGGHDMAKNILETMDIIEANR